MLRGALLCWAAGLLLAFATWQSAYGDDAAILQSMVDGYRDGVFLAEREDYREFYATTQNRKITLIDVRRTDQHFGGLFVAEYDRDGEHVKQTGVFRFVADGGITDVWHVNVDDDMIDMALAGQMGDVASTAVGLSAGLVEANPIVAPLADGAGFLLLAGIKYAIVQIASQGSYEECYENRSLVGMMGMGATAWNVGMLINPGLALILGTLAAYHTADDQRRSASLECLPTMGDVSIGRVG